MKFKNRLFPVIICPAWIPELNSVEQGLEGKGGLPGSPEGLGCWRRRMGNGGCQESLPSGSCGHLLLLELPCMGTRAR